MRQKLMRLVGAGWLMAYAHNVILSCMGYTAVEVERRAIGRPSGPVRPASNRRSGRRKAYGTSRRHRAA